MKKIIISVILISMILTGCSDSSEYLLPFSWEQGVANDSMSKDSFSTYAATFANDICIIPVNYKNEDDGNLTALSSLMVDISEDKVVYGTNVYKRLFPASITKIFTAYVVLKHTNLNDVVTISKKAANITESGAKLCGFNQGDTIKLDTLLHSFLIYSGNDAGVALAEHVSGSVEKFSDLMNEEIRLLGAVDSHFVNPHGLHDEDHYTTAYDIYLVFNELLKNDKFVSIISNGNYTAEYNDKKGNKIQKTFATTNRYLNGKADSPEGLTVIGGKTGTTYKAGSCLVLYSTAKDDHSYISLILKADSGDALFSQMSYLLKLRNR